MKDHPLDETTDPAALDAMNATLKRMVKVPPKPHGEMKTRKEREPSKLDPRRGSDEKAEKPSDRPKAGR